MILHNNCSVEAVKASFKGNNFGYCLQIVYNTFSSHSKFLLFYFKNVKLCKSKLRTLMLLCCVSVKLVPHISTEIMCTKIINQELRCQAFEAGCANSMLLA